MTPEMITQIYAYTALVVGFLLTAAGFGSALGWALICSKYLEGVARQPEMQRPLMIQMFISGGLMEAFPFIILGISMWFIFANPFLGAAKIAIGG